MAIKVFVSGCFELLHGGHIQFFEDAKRLGDILIVSFASDKVLLKYKGRKAILPEAHRRKILEALRPVDKVVMGSNSEDYIFDFKNEFIEEKADILVSTTDDKRWRSKDEFCKQHGAKYIQIPKSLDFPMISTTEIRNNL